MQEILAREIWRMGENYFVKHFFKGTPESGQGVKMSEIESFFDSRMIFCDPLDFRKVIYEKPKFHEKKSQKNHTFDNNIPKIKWEKIIRK